MSKTGPIAVIGTGLIGSSWAALFATLGGHSVHVWDPDRMALEKAKDQVALYQEQLRILFPDMGGTIAYHLRIEDAVTDAGWVQENAPDKMEIKRKLYAEIEAIARPDSIIASSTSALVWSDLADGLNHPERFITAHPFNPPHLIPLVELFGPTPKILDHATSFFKAMKREPVILKKESSGHIAGRLSAALWQEAISLVADGVASVGDVDRALMHGPALRWAIIGVHMGYHMGGGRGGIAGYLEKLGSSQERRWASLGHPSLTPNVQNLLVQGVEEAAPGKSIDEISAAYDQGLMALLETFRKLPS